MDFAEVATNLASLAPCFGGANNRDEIATYWENRSNETYEECEGNCTIAYAGPLFCTDSRVSS